MPRPVGEPVRTSPRRVAARLAKEAEAEGTAVYELTERLARRRSADERRVACELAVLQAADDPQSALAILESLIEDKDASVARAAVHAAAQIADAHLERVLVLLTSWRDAPSPHLRRAAAAAAAQSAQPHRLERAPQLARFVKPLLGSPDTTVRRTVARATLPALVRAYPEAAFEALLEASMTSDPGVLRDVAAALACPAAAPLAKRALIVLRKLALDERRLVWRAAAAAMWRLGRIRPDVVRPELERWLEDDARAAAAREALKYL